MLEPLEQPAVVDMPDSSAANTAPADSNADSLQDLVNRVDADTDPANPEAAAPADDEIDEELDGVKVRGSKEALEKLKSERLMQADYTRKTQEVADQRRQFEAQRQQFQNVAQAHQQYIEEVADLRAVDKQLSQFANVNWNQLTEQDPVQALKLHTTFTQLQAARGQLVGALTQKQQAAAAEQQRETAKQLMDARQVLERDIKGWSPDLANKLMDFGVKLGFPAEALQNVTRPEVVKVLHKAYLFDQLEQQRAKKPPTAPAQPVTRVGGAAAATTKPLSEVSDAEFIRRRREYIQKNR